MHVLVVNHHVDCLISGLYHILELVLGLSGSLVNRVLGLPPEAPD